MIHVKLIKHSLFVFFLTILLSCTEKVKSIEQSSTKEHYNDVELPIANGGRIIFVIKNDSIFQIKLREIDKIYSEKYSQESDFNIFLNRIVNNDKLSISEIKEISYFHSKVNEKFLNKYKKTDVNILKEKFCINTGYKIYIKNDLDYDTQITLCYIFFKYKYFIVYDDIEGVFIVGSEER